MTYSSIFKKNSKEVRQNEPLCFFVLSFFSISIQFFSQTFSVFLNTIYNIGDDLNGYWVEGIHQTKEEHSLYVEKSLLNSCILSIKGSKK